MPVLRREKLKAAEAELAAEREGSAGASKQRPAGARGLKDAAGAGAPKAGQTDMPLDEALEKLGSVRRA